jgi:hypothetical protein
MMRRRGEGLWRQCAASAGGVVNIFSSGFSKLMEQQVVFETQHLTFLCILLQVCSSCASKCL